MHLFHEMFSLMSPFYHQLIPKQLPFKQSFTIVNENTNLMQQS